MAVAADGALGPYGVPIGEEVGEWRLRNSVEQEPESGAPGRPTCGSSG